LERFERKAAFGWIFHEKPRNFIKKHIAIFVSKLFRVVELLRVFNGRNLICFAKTNQA
jgi:hypothetical protein